MSIMDFTVALIIIAFPRFFPFCGGGITSGTPPPLKKKKNLNK